MVTDADAIIERVRAARRVGASEDVLQALKEAVRTNSSDARLWHALGLVYRDLADSRPAVDALSVASRLMPSSAAIAHALARATHEAGGAAYELFENARRLAPADGAVLLGRAAAQMAEGRGHQAIADLQIILHSNSSWIEGHELLASFQWMMGERDAYGASVTAALAGLPKNHQLWQCYFDLLVKVERFQELDQRVTEARRIAGEARVFQVYEAVSASEIGDDERASKLFDVMQPIQQIGLAVRHIRHEARYGRFDQAAAIGERFLADQAVQQMLPYLASVWRILGDPRCEIFDNTPQLVGIYDVGTEIDLSGLARVLRQLHVAKAEMAGQSVRGGTQTDGPLFSRTEPEIQNLKRLVATTVRKHLRRNLAQFSHPLFGSKPDVVRFAGSWSVRLQGAGHHTPHIHPEGYLSSAFYVTVPEPPQRGAAPSGWLALGAPPPELNFGLSPQCYVEPKPGRLVLFPSIMWHGTEPFAAGERMTVAFDIAPART